MTRHGRRTAAPRDGPEDIGCARSRHAQSAPSPAQAAIPAPMSLAPSATPLPPADLERGLANLVRDGVWAQGAGALTAGVLLVGYALSLGASNLTIGLLAAVPMLAQLAQVPAILLVEHTRTRRRIAVWCLAASRALLIPLAFLPFVPSPNLALTLLITGVGVSAALGAVAACSWNSWIHDLVPEERLGEFFARRMFYATALGMVAGLLAGEFVNWWEASARGRPVHAYTVLFVLGALAGALSTHYLANVPEPRMAPPERTLDLVRMLAEPFHHENFRRLIWFLGAWQFATNLAAPFFAVYLVSQLGYSMAFVIQMMIVSQLANLLVTRQWGRYADRFSNKAVLRVCGPLHLVCLLAWTLVAMPQTEHLAVPLLVLLHVVMGFAASGVNLASGNIGLKLAPRGRATAYLAAGSLVNSVAAGLAPILGGLFADDFSERELALVVRWTSGPRASEVVTLSLRHWDFFFLLACVLGLYALHRLALVREQGWSEDQALLDEIVAETRRAMAGVSSIAGVLLMTVFPFGRLLRIARAKRLRRR